MARSSASSSARSAAVTPGIVVWPSILVSAREMGPSRLYGLRQASGNASWSAGAGVLSRKAARHRARSILAVLVVFFIPFDGDHAQGVGGADEGAQRAADALARARQPWHGQAGFQAARGAEDDAVAAGCAARFVQD